MSDSQNTTMNELLSTTEFSNKLNLNLSNMQVVADSLKTVLNNNQLNSIGDISSLMSPEKLQNTMKEQIDLISCTLASLGPSSIIGQSAVQNTLNTALSTVMGTMTCNLASMQESLSKINQLSSQVENIKASLKSGNIDELKKAVK